jgi:hypothetical protein
VDGEEDAFRIYILLHITLFTELHFSDIFLCDTIEMRMQLIFCDDLLIWNEAE